MKLAITATTPNIEASLDQRFGRCSYFILIDTLTKEWESVPNPAVESPHGAGTQSAQFLVEQEIDAVISNKFGPNASKVLVSAGVSLWESKSGNVKAILDAFLKGKLKQVEYSVDEGSPYSEHDQ